MSYYVAMDIGCLECGEGSHCLGVFKTEQAAQAAIDAPKLEQAANWHGQHYFEVFEVSSLNTPQAVEYAKR